MGLSQVKGERSKRYFGVATVILLHVLILYIAINASTHAAVDILDKPFEVKIIDEKIPPPQDVSRPTSQPKNIAVRIPFVPPPEIVVDLPRSLKAIVAVSKEAPTPSPPSMQQMIDAPPLSNTSSDTKAHTDLQSCKPSYPATSMVFEEQGVVRIRFVIGADDQLKDVKVLQSSGHRRLDQAAVWALSRCIFKAALHDGKPIESSITTDYVWRISDYQD